MPSFNDVMEEALTWKTVGEQLALRGRGAAYQLAGHLGMNSSFLYRKLRGRGEPTEAQARAIREFLGQAPAPTQPLIDRRRLEVYARPVAGDQEDRIHFAPGQAIDTLELPMGLALGPGEYFVARPPGSLMEPRIFPGETLVVRRDYPPAHGRDALIEFTDGTAMVRTYKGQSSGQVFVEQYNDRKVVGYFGTTVRAIHAVAFKL
jgi:phage repressor protein C with HTH and peptisase S24 domain